MKEFVNADLLRMSADMLAQAGEISDEEPFAAARRTRLYRASAHMQLAMAELEDLTGLVFSTRAKPQAKCHEPADREWHERDRVVHAGGRSEHQLRVERTNRLWGQAMLESPAVPPPDVRLLRARLILEEALETISRGLGVTVRVEGFPGEIGFEQLLFSADKEPDLVELADGCADLSVVTVGTLGAFGVADLPLLEEVDKNNLAKVQGGRRDENGKWVKPVGHQPPDIAGVLRRQGWKG